MIYRLVTWYVLVASMQYLRVKSVNTNWFVDLPEVTSIRFGRNAFSFQAYYESSKLIMRRSDDKEEWWIDLPKLASLTSAWGTFCNPHSITMEGTYYHSIIINRHAFSHYCISPWRIWVKKWSAYQQYCFSNDIMNRCWSISKSSCSCLTFKCYSSFCGWIEYNGFECGNDYRGWM